MDIEIVSRLYGEKLNKRNALLCDNGLQPDTDVEQTALLWDDGNLIAVGSRAGNLLKCIAVERARRGEDLTATILSALRQEAFGAGYRHLFLYTKPQNRLQFETLFFYPIVQTDDVLLMENEKDGILRFLGTFPKETSDDVGAIVMNCDPFTLGHRHLIETAAEQCKKVYVFVLSEDRGTFTAEERLTMVKNGTAHLDNVTVLPTGPYLISTATFPSYFLKDQTCIGEVHCRLDIAVFSEYYIPRFGITRRFVGEEPFCEVTRQYNEALKRFLPIPVTEIPRFETEGTPVSASHVRRLLKDGDTHAAATLVPATTAEFFKGGHPV